MLNKSILCIGIALLAACSSNSPKGDKSDVVLKFNNNCSHTLTSFNCVKVVEVYDGDTIFIDLPGQHPLFGQRMGVRIFGIDTPEIRTKNSCEKLKGQLAKKLLDDAISHAKRVDIVDVQKDKFFRILGTVLVDGKSVTDVLIKANLAFPYYGERKPKRNWCN